MGAFYCKGAAQEPGFQGFRGIGFSLFYRFRSPYLWFLISKRIGSTWAL